MSYAERIERGAAYLDREYPRLGAPHQHIRIGYE